MKFWTDSYLFVVSYFNSWAIGNSWQIFWTVQHFNSSFMYSDFRKISTRIKLKLKTPRQIHTFYISPLSVDTHRVCDSWSEGPEYNSCTGCFGVDIYQWCLTCSSKAWWFSKLSMRLRGYKWPFEYIICGKIVIVSRLRVSFCHRYVNNSYANHKAINQLT